jgi:hypothetical protein
MVAGSGVEVACIKEGGFHRLSEMRIQDKKKVSERVRESATWIRNLVERIRTVLLMDGVFGHAHADVLPLFVPIFKYIF